MTCAIRHAVVDGADHVGASDWRKVPAAAGRVGLRLDGGIENAEVGRVTQFDRLPVRSQDDSARVERTRHVDGRDRGRLRPQRLTSNVCAKLAKISLPWQPT